MKEESLLPQLEEILKFNRQEQIKPSKNFVFFALFFSIEKV